MRDSLLSLILLLVSAVLLPAAERVALVVGNDAYVHGSPLTNCLNDARAVAAGLRACDFEVTVVENVGLAEFEKRVREFKVAATGAKAAWFYYAGHGAELERVNYLIPVDAEVTEEHEVKFKTLPLDMVLGALEGAKTPLKVVVLDCCRNNPLGRGWSRSGDVGLAAVSDAPDGTIIAYSTSPGKKSADGTGLKNSPYATALVAALAKPGLDVSQVLRETGRGVKMATRDKQVPWMNMNFYGDFILRSGSLEVAPAEPSPFPDGSRETPAMPAGGATTAVYSYALGFRSGGGFKETFGKFGVKVEDLNQTSFFVGLSAAMMGKSPLYPDDQLQKSMEALGNLLKKREKGEAGELGVEDTKISSHALGFRAGGEFNTQFGKYGLTSADLDAGSFRKGFIRAFRGLKAEHGDEALQEAMAALGANLEARDKGIAAENLEKGAAFLKANALRKGVITTSSGLQYEVMAKGGNRRYSAAEETKNGEVNFMVRYKGSLIDDQEFDRSPEGEAVSMTLSVIEGFKEALKLMPVGAKWKVFIPSALGYGEERRNTKITPNSALIFEMEMVDIEYK